jgi:hypothetical protein
MSSNTVKIMCALLFCTALLTQAGCGLCGICKPAVKTVKAPEPAPPPVVVARNPCEEAGANDMTVLPANAKPGECYAKVFVPPTFRTVTERIKVRDASEIVEVVPAKYEWVEEKILLKDASTQLEPVPAEFAAGEQTIEVRAADTDWEINKKKNCITPKDQPAKDIVCLVRNPAEQKTIPTQKQVRPASVREVVVPAQYQTVRREKLVSPATTKKTVVPAEYETVEKLVKVCPGRMAWRLIDCDEPGATRAAAPVEVKETPKATQSSKTASVKKTRATRR